MCLLEKITKCYIWLSIWVWRTVLLDDLLVDAIWVLDRNVIDEFKNGKRTMRFCICSSRLITSYAVNDIFQSIYIVRLYVLVNSMWIRGWMQEAGVRDAQHSTVAEFACYPSSCLSATNESYSGFLFVDHADLYARPKRYLQRWRGLPRSWKSIQYARNRHRWLWSLVTAYRK